MGEVAEYAELSSSRHVFSWNDMIVGADVLSTALARMVPVSAIGLPVVGNPGGACPSLLLAVRRTRFAVPCVRSLHEFDQPVELGRLAGGDGECVLRAVRCGKLRPAPIGV
jgi:hypothetical protein